MGVGGVGHSGWAGLAGPVGGVVGGLHYGPLAVCGRAGVTAGGVAADLLGSGGGVSSTGRCQRCVERFQLSVVRIVKRRNYHLLLAQVFLTSKICYSQKLLEIGVQW